MANRLPRPDPTVENLNLRDETEERLLDAGDYLRWSGEMRGAIAGHNDADVSCGSCTACCTSSQFVVIGPEETDALAHIPRDLLFPAPRMPGHVVLGYDKQGRCPLLKNGQCSIYAHRPRTCRTYDCRVFAAAETYPSEPTKVSIAKQAKRWRFRFDSDRNATSDLDDQEDRTQVFGRTHQQAVAVAARFLSMHSDELPSEITPLTDTHLAVLAFKVHELFLDPSNPPTVAAIVSLSSQNEQQSP